MSYHMDSADIAPALTELHDAFARVRAQVHVLRLAMAGVRDERDVRALLCQLGTIEDELHQSEKLLRQQQGPAH